MNLLSSAGIGDKLRQLVSGQRERVQDLWHVNSLETLVERCESMETLEKAVQFFFMVNLIHMAGRIERSA